MAGAWTNTRMTVLIEADQNHSTTK